MSPGTGREAAVEPLSCAEFVELVTDYLEGALDVATTARFEQHAALCLGCEDYLDQFRETIRQTGRVDPGAVPPEALDRLLAAFRDWSRER